MDLRPKPEKMCVIDGKEIATVPLPMVSLEISCKVLGHLLEMSLTCSHKTKLERENCFLLAKSLIADSSRWNPKFRLTLKGDPSPTSG